MRLAFSTIRQPELVNLHIPGRHTDSKGRTDKAERTWCGIVLCGGWTTVETEREPTCEKCIEYSGYGLQEAA